MNDRLNRAEEAVKNAHNQRGPAAVPDDFSNRVVAAVREEHRQSQVVDFPEGDGGLWLFARFAAAAAAMALILGYSQYAYGDTLVSIWSTDLVGLTTVIAGY